MAPDVSKLGKRMVTEDEGVLIARSRDGDWEAFAEVVQRHQRMIHSLTYRMSGSVADSEDLAQETFIRAYRSLGTYRGDAKFSSWLYRIALNLCMRWRERERRRGVTEGEWARGDAAGKLPDARGESVLEALARLSPRQRAAIVLTTFDGMTHSEAAAILGCAEKTLSWHLFAARRRLAKLLREEGGTP
jgi:RNA polymerase sigma-70 factor, ECF subfamily